MNEYITLKTDEVVAFINILEILYLKCDDGDCINSMYDDMQTLRRLRDDLKIFDKEDENVR